jgi:hypothetical protein
VAGGVLGGITGFLLAGFFGAATTGAIIGSGGVAAPILALGTAGIFTGRNFEAQEMSHMKSISMQMAVQEMFSGGFNNLDVDTSMSPSDHFVDAVLTLGESLYETGDYWGSLHDLKRLAMKGGGNTSDLKAKLQAYINDIGLNTNEISLEIRDDEEFNFVDVLGGTKEGSINDIPLRLTLWDFPDGYNDPSRRNLRIEEKVSNSYTIPVSKISNVEYLEKDIKFVIQEFNKCKIHQPVCLSKVIPSMFYVKITVSLDNDTEEVSSTFTTDLSKTMATRSDQISQWNYLKRFAHALKTSSGSTNADTNYLGFLAEIAVLAVDNNTGDEEFKRVLKFMLDDIGLNLEPAYPRVSDSDIIPVNAIGRLVVRNDEVDDGLQVEEIEEEEEDEESGGEQLGSNGGGVENDTESDLEVLSDESGDIELGSMTNDDEARIIQVEGYVISEPIPEILLKANEETSMLLSIWDNSVLPMINNRYSVRRFFTMKIPDTMIRLENVVTGQIQNHSVAVAKWVIPVNKISRVEYLKKNISIVRNEIVECANMNIDLTFCLPDILLKMFYVKIHVTTPVQSNNVHLRWPDSYKTLTFSVKVNDPSEPLTKSSLKAKWESFKALFNAVEMDRRNNMEE